MSKKRPAAKTDPFARLESAAGEARQAYRAQAEELDGARQALDAARAELGATAAELTALSARYTELQESAAKRAAELESERDELRARIAARVAELDKLRSVFGVVKRELDVAADAPAPPRKKTKRRRKGSG